MRTARHPLLAGLLSLSVVLAGACCCAPMGALALPAAAADPAPPAPVAASREGLALTVYNDDHALVRELRRFALQAGDNRIAMRGVAARIQPESASLKSMSGPAFAVIEQGEALDPLDPGTLLRHYLGRELQVIGTNPATGQETRSTARVLSVRDGVVLRYADRIETGVPGRLAFPELPAGLEPQPVLYETVQSRETGEARAELSYLTTGIGWQADYAATLSADGTRLGLTGWITVTNHSGTGFEAARLQVVAGTLNRAGGERRAPLARPLAMAAAAPAPPAEEKLADLHLYTVARSVDIQDNEVRQFALLSVAAVPVARELVLEGRGGDLFGRRPGPGRTVHPEVVLSLRNQGEGLGRPLPAGTVRVYADDARGGAIEVGEDAIGHTAAGERLRLRLGAAFDVGAERTQTDARQVAERVWRSSYRIELHNGGERTESVTVVEPMQGDWTVQSETLPHVQRDAATAVWTLAVPAHGAATLEYTVQVKS